MTSLADFNREIRQKIPSLELLQMEFVEFSPRRVRLTAQFLPNKNHINTAFGGSLYLAATSACYGLFRAMTEGAGSGQEVIILKTGAIDYLKPVEGSFEVIAESEETFALDKMLATVAKVGHGKLELKSRVMFAGDVCATFRGVFVLRKKSESKK